MTRFAGPSWLIPAPGPDESLQSLVDRASIVYGASPEDLWADFGSALDESPDALRGPALARLARVVGVAPAQLHDHGLPDHPRWLAPSQRVAVCPACRSQDADAGRPGGRRRGWANVFATLCPVHQTPLQVPGGLAPVGLCADPRAVPPALQRIEAFSRRVEAALFDQAPWPSDWLGDAHLARSLILAAALNLSPVPAFPVACAVMAPAEIDPWVAAQAHLQAPLKRCAWESFRRQADPAQRRRAFWFAGCFLDPELGEGLPRRLTWLEKLAKPNPKTSTEARSLSSTLCRTLADRARGTLS